MAITRRAMRPADITKCMTMVGRDPIMLRRFSGCMRGMESALQSIIGRDAVHAVVFESGTCVAGIGISVFVTDTFARGLLTPPYSWGAAMLVGQMDSGSAPILTDDELPYRNGTTGLSLYVVLAWIHPEHRADPEVVNALMTGFIEEHRGYNLRELISQSDMGMTVETTLRAGGLIRGEDGRYVDAPAKAPDDFVNEPHCFHLTRDMARKRTATWVSSLFMNDAPRIYFSAAERRLLTVAATGRTDSELAATLGISVSGVKKTWTSIYRRAGDRAPSIFPDDVAPATHRERGRTKKQYLLAYLKDHPEELRPFAKAIAR